MTPKHPQQPAPKPVFTVRQVSEGYVIDLNKSGPWLTPIRYWTPHRDRRGVWPTLAAAEAALARFLSQPKIL